MHTVWNVIALDTPRVVRRCPRCDVARPFASSDRFRVNAQKRLLDVWLVYRCPACETSWNRTVVERASPERVARLDAYHANDRDEAWAVAFDLRGVAADARVPYRVERRGAGSEIVLALRWPCEVRLDRLLAAELGVARGALLVGDPAALRRPVHDGQRVALQVRQED
jgi:hypothetical protein